MKNFAIKLVFGWSLWDRSTDENGPFYSRRLQSGIPLINALANICLKARAHRELFDRKTAGDKTVDEKVVQKHLKDIWRIATVLTGEEKVTLTGQPLKDLASAIGKLDQLPDTQFKQVMEKTPNLKKNIIMTTLKQIFL